MYTGYLLPKESAAAMDHSWPSDHQKVKKKRKSAELFDHQNALPRWRKHLGIRNKAEVVGLSAVC